MRDSEQEEDIDMDNINGGFDDDDDDENDTNSDFPDIQIKFDENGFPISPPLMDVTKTGEITVVKSNRRRQVIVEEEPDRKIGLALMPESEAKNPLGIDLFLANFKMYGTELICEHKTSIPLPESSLLKNLLKESNFTPEDWIAYIKKAVDVDKLAEEIYNALIKKED